MNRVHQQLAPEQIANAPERSIGVSDLAIEVRCLESSDSFDSLLVHHAECGREGLHRFRAFDVRGLDVELKLAPFDAERHIRVDLSEVPRELSERSSACVWPKIIPIARQSAHERERAVSFMLPGFQKILKFRLHVISYFDE
jgi:hypothetical protein